MKHPIVLVIIIALLLALLPYLPLFEHNESKHIKYDEAEFDVGLPLLDTDGDGMPDDWELKYGLDPTYALDANDDKDNDGWDFDRNGYIEGGIVNETYTNLEEYYMGTDPTNKDSDNDGMIDGWEVFYGFLPMDPTDAGFDPDRDGYDANDDGFFDEDENFSNLKEFQADTNPRNPDTDKDGMTDGWEAYYELDPLDPKDRDEDPDHDGFDLNRDNKISTKEQYVNLEEFYHDTNPREQDTDHDGIPDGWEAHYYDEARDHDDPIIRDNAEQLNPKNPEGKEEDLDQDQLSNFEEYSNPFHVPDLFDLYNSTDPIEQDTDGDGLLDGKELYREYHGSPLLDPSKNDTDGDFMSDGWEIHWDDGWLGDDAGIHFLDPADGSDGDRDEENFGEGDGWDANRNGEIDVSENYDERFTNREEFLENSNPFMSDTDGDGMPDGFEAIFNLDPSRNDSGEDKDDDSFNTYLAMFGFTSVPDGMYTNFMEYNNGINWTIPSNNDTDNDIMWDGWEFYYGLDPLNNTDDDDDPDQDGYDYNHDGFRAIYENFTNLDEFRNGTDPFDPDTDGDGMPDGWEVHYGLNPLFDDSQEDKDGDNITNYQEWDNTFFDVDGIIPMDPSSVDTDGDGLNDEEETILGEDGFITDPTSKDTDGDGMPDGWEVHYHLNPRFAPDADYDPDDDGSWLDTNFDGTYDTDTNFSNLMEYQNGTDPRDPDTDNDTMPDGWETFHDLNATNPLDKELDLDNDGILNYLEYDSPELNSSDTDGFIYTDPSLVDTDWDGLLDSEELGFAAPTDPTNNDTDFDDMDDGWEVKYTLDPLDPSDAKLDSDMGGIGDSYDIDGNGVITRSENYTNLKEYENQTNPLLPDTDDDGIWDVWEAYYQHYCRSSIDANIANLAGDFNPNDKEGSLEDSDKDGLDNYNEFSNPLDYDSRLSTNPLSNDTDEDGIFDGIECYGRIGYDYLTDPTTEDTDNDGMPDGWETNYTFGWIIPGELGDHYLDPTDATDANIDTDDDGYDPPYPWVPEYYREFTNYKEYIFWVDHPEYLCNPFDWDTLFEGYSDGFGAFIIDQEGG